MRVSLLDFEDPRGRYELDTDSNEVSLHRCDSEAEAESGTRGLGAFVKVGLLQSRRSFFAFHVHERRLFLIADRRSLELTGGEFRVSRTSVAPFVKRFSVWRGRQRVFSSTYWFSDLREDGFVPRDFLSYLAREVAPTSKHEKKILSWEELAAGRDPSRPSFQQELNRVLQSKG